MALVDDVKVALRVSSEMLMPEVDALIEAAKRDLLRVGVPPFLLAEDTLDPLCRVAVILYCKAGFGYDNAEASRFQSSYRQIVKDILNSPTQYRKPDLMSDAYVTALKNGNGYEVE